MPSNLLRINNPTVKHFAIQHRQLVLFGVAWILLIVPLLIIRQQSSLGFPWTQLTTWETATTYPVKEELIKGLGIVFFTAIIGIFYVFKKRTIESTLVLLWLFVPLTLIPFSTLLSINAIRLTQGALFVPMAAMAVYGIKFLASALRHVPVARRLGEKGIELLLIAGVVSISIPTIIHSFKAHKADLWNQASNIYLSHSDVRTFTALGQSTPPGSFVLCSFFTCNTAAGYSAGKMYIGSWTYTYNLGEKEAQTQKFLRGEMREEEAKQFLFTNEIDFVITVNHDNWLYGWPGNRYPSLLEPLYEEGTNGVYRVKIGG